ncbi:hypothetical protein [Verrucomicrobium sp. BvORR106]|uniref:hypothetical protein n=1 Tax=Verrucomicrobium sp. BvORR106 TaxID=1403819 RepID=UPI0005705706|nr:hypothetical protein [Verrucomicrobium sp. BvORR106]
MAEDPSISGLAAAAGAQAPGAGANGGNVGGGGGSHAAAGVGSSGGADPEENSANPTGKKGASHDEDRADATRDRFDEFLSDSNRVTRPLGVRCNIPEFDRWVNDFGKVRQLAISGNDWDSCLWSASEIALRNSTFAHIFICEPVTVGINIEKLQERLRRFDAEPVCIIWKFLDQIHAKTFADWFRSLVKVAEGLERTPHALILCVHQKGCVSLVNENRWAYFHRLDLLGLGVEQQVDMEQAGRDKLEDLVGGSAESLESLLTSDEKMHVPRTLARLVVLFQGLAASSVEMLLQGALRERMIEVTPATEKVEAKRINAGELWRKGRGMFEKQAGVGRGGADGQAPYKFESTAYAERITEWVWSYPEELFELLLTICKDRPIYFGDVTSEAERNTYWEFASTASMIAVQAPGLFAMRWRELMESDLRSWLEKQSGVQVAKEDLLGMLVLIDQAHEFTRYWWRSAVRLGDLCGRLTVAKAGRVAEDFIYQMLARGLHAMAFEVVVAMEESCSEENRLKWFSRIINEGKASVREFVTRRMARIVSEQEGLAPVYLQIADKWLTEAERRQMQPVRKVALALPALVLDNVTGSVFDATKEESPLLNVLNLEMSAEVTALDLCRKAMTDEDFSSAAAPFHNMDYLREIHQQAFAVALAGYQLGAGLPDSRRTMALDLFSQILEGFTLDDRIRVSQWLDRFSNHWLEEMDRAAVALGDRAVARQAEALRLYTVCQDLLGC